MSDNNDDNDSGPGPSYDVGYGKPPVATRFQKGASGNPLGRPRKPRLIKVPLADADNLDVVGMVLEDAVRQLVVTENGKKKKMETIKAVIRGRGLNAVKGSRLAQKDYISSVEKAIELKRARQLEFFKALVESKRWGEAEIERCRSRGLPRPDLLPDPDDIIIDPWTGEGYIDGPVTVDERRELESFITMREKLQEMASRIAARYRAARSAKTKKFQIDQWESVRMAFDNTNNSIPERYRKAFEGSSPE